MPRDPRVSDVPIKKPAVCHTPAPTKTAPINSKPKKAPRRKKLSAKWLFDASMLSSPMDLSPLVSMSLEAPEDVVGESGLLKRMVKTVLNGPGVRNRVGRQARLDVRPSWRVCPDHGPCGSRRARCIDGRHGMVRRYMAEEGNEMDRSEETPEPELHKAMLVLLCRAGDYKLKTEDLLELCRGHRK